MQLVTFIGGVTSIEDVIIGLVLSDGWLEKIKLMLVYVLNKVKLELSSSFMSLIFLPFTLLVHPNYVNVLINVSIKLTILNIFLLLVYLILFIIIIYFILIELNVYLLIFMIY